MLICRAQVRRGMAMAGQRQSRSGRRRNAARRTVAAAAASAAGQGRSIRAQRQGAASGGSRQAQDSAVRERDGLDDAVTPAEIDRVIAAYQRNAEPEVAARVDRKMAEEIIRDSNAWIRESTNERISECISERIDYNRRVGIPRDLIRAYGLQLA